MRAGVAQVGASFTVTEPQVTVALCILVGMATRKRPRAKTALPDEFPLRGPQPKTLYSPWKPRVSDPTDKTLWPDLSLLEDTADSGGERALQRLLTALGLDRKCWDAGHRKSRERIRELARELLRLQTTLLAALVPDSVCTPTSAAKIQQRAHQKIVALTSEVREKTTGTASVSSKIEALAMEEHAFRFRDAMVVALSFLKKSGLQWSERMINERLFSEALRVAVEFSDDPVFVEARAAQQELIARHGRPFIELEALQDKAEPIYAVLEAVEAFEMAERYMQTPVVIVEVPPDPATDLKQPSPAEPIVNESDVKALHESTPRAVAVLITYRVFGRFVSLDDLRRKKMKRR